MNHPDNISPYYPSSRLVIHPIYIDILSLEEFNQSDRAKQKWQEVLPFIEEEKKKVQINYKFIYNIFKKIILEVYKEFISNPKFESKRKEFEEYKNNNLLLLYHSLFEVVTESFGNLEPNKDLWKPNSEIQTEFCKVHQERINFYSYLFF